ncbi:tRNA1(Val) (adenine(37)-N6)-methyltransferase [Pedobacter glucosidilyticus]|uniref:tRNA1(Val) (adenine(37)-N6)-methyltransferase n=1 Tax=Pedobacter glucosidilyticus TaxID=1122941 RepID=UPI00042374A8|nr:methyltransferase [Pedobacter glucosidilyticus]
MSVFHFKEFVVNQENCPMKINTDGVLLGALCDVEDAISICDIGTGTGVIALMLAQRNHQAKIDALDIDYRAVDTASINFQNSLFHERLAAHHHSFIEFFEMHPSNRYDLIISNPPFFLHALKSPHHQTNLAKHTDETFFINLLRVASTHLHDKGSLEIIVPVEISLLLQHLANDYYLHLERKIVVKSFQGKEAFRHILKLQKNPSLEVQTEVFTIYEKEGEHSLQYRSALKNFFTIF